MSRNLLLLLIGLFINFSNPLEAVTVYLFKSFSAEANQPANPADKIYYSNRATPLSTEGVKQALSLHSVIQEKGPFNHIYAASNLNAVETAILATSENDQNLNERVQNALAGKGDITVTQNWRQVDLGSFEGVTPVEIQKAYEKVHPEAKFIPEPNDCLNFPWEGQREYHFEPYNTEFKQRILLALKEIETSSKPGDKVAVFTVSEPIRTVMLLSKPSEEFKASKFYKQILDNPTITDKMAHADTTLDVLAHRYNFKPNDGSWIKVELKDGKITLLEVSDNVIFRNEAPVPGYLRSYIPSDD